VFLFCVKATHNRAGEILYKRVAPFSSMVGGNAVPTYSYLITVIVYTDHGQNVADRCADTVYFGDGTRGIAKRINGTVSGCCGQIPCGDVIINQANYAVKLNTYTITHVYSGAGNYLIRMFDPNRNANVRNMTNSINQAFYLESYLVINNLTGANSSPVFNYDPIDRACVDKCFYHNPGAYDPDGDLLTFEITTSRKADGQTVDGYYFPSDEGGTYNINATTGLLSWCSPKHKAEYNLAFIVKEWRKNTSGVYVMIGYVLRDMQVVVDVCPSNDPPIIIVPQDTCVEAGTLIKKKITVMDVTPSPTIISIVNLEGNAGAFSVTSPTAVLSPVSGIATYTSQFSWQTTCDHVRQQPHVTVFKATDNGAPFYSNGTPQVNLVSFSTYNIRVVPSSVKNVTAVPAGSTMKISWSLSTCLPSGNPLKSYKIYRKNDCGVIAYQACQTGVSPTSGLSEIGEVNSTTSIFIDDNNGNGLVVGQNYSYVVVASYSDGTETFGSTQVCAKLKRNVPVLLNVDILSTSATNGSVGIRWEKPFTNVDDLDTNTFHGPYQFDLKYRANSTAAFSSIYKTSSPYFLNLNTSYTHTNVNTVDGQGEYTVEFTAGTTIIGSSQVANSVFLSASGADRKIQLKWQSKTPWNNYKYTVFRKNLTSTTYTAIATTSLTGYNDTVNIVNRYAYCYKILSEGEYSDPSISKPLLNNSQEVCATAVDLTAPCTPTLTMDADCLKGFVNVNWSNGKPICAASDDVLKYVLFYKATVEEAYKEIDTLYGAGSTNFSLDGLSLISGCYAVQAIDSSGNASGLSPDFCVDNCPEFELPNIVTPNGDNANDFYKAIKVRQIKEIDLSIYDRWGNLVYKTKDPYFQWNTISILSKQPVSDGTFFYICDVFEPRLTGIVKRTIKGYMEVIR
jgi:gliding motility-associated-like protein